MRPIWEWFKLYLTLSRYMYHFKVDTNITVINGNSNDNKDIVIECIYLRRNVEDFIPDISKP